MLVKFLLISFAFLIDVELYVLDKRYNTCNTEKCRNMANLIINSMNKTADPCNNFYNYACGSWPINYPVPKGKLTWDLGEKVTNNIQAELIKILQEEPKSEDNVPLSIEKKLFKACMNEERIERKGIEGVSKIIESLGGWPIIMNDNDNNKWNENDFPWQKVVKGFLENNIDNPFFSIGFLPDTKNSSIKRISLDQTEEKFLKNQFTESLLKSLETVDDEDTPSTFEMFAIFMKFPLFYANSLNYDVDLFTMAPKIFDLMFFLKELSSIKSPPRDNDILELENKLTISEFQLYYNRNKTQKSTSKIDWLEMIQLYTRGGKININGSEPISIYGDKLYFKRLFDLLEKSSHEKIVNFLHWYLLLFQIEYLNKDARELKKDFMKVATGIRPAQEDRTVECESQQLLKHAVTKEYLKKNFPESLSYSVKEIAKDIRNEIINEILKTNLMDEKTKLLTKEKLNAMKLQTVHPDFYDNEKEFNKFYDGLEISEDHFDNMMRINEFDRVEDLKAFRLPYRGNEWFMGPLIPNAYYNPSGNSLTVPAGMLLYPTCNANMELMLANYGSVGFIMGHEMSHGFDMQGYKYDKNGNVNPLWPKEVETKFKTRANCFIKQYNKYGVDGELTQSENIADSLGLNAAYSAFIRKANNFTEFKLPRLENVSQNQLFFLNFANSFCESTTKYYEEKTKNDVHTQISIRINGAVANVKGFAEAFQCPKNSHLNPNERCIIWK